MLRSDRIGVPARRRKGAIAVLAAVMLVGVLALMAVAIDIGFMLTVRTEMQAAADAGALAGVGELPRGQQAARRAAADYVKQNARTKDGDLATTVEFGHWNRGSRSFAVGLEPLNAVRVIADRSNAPRFFGKAIRQDNFQMRASAVATYRPRDIMLVLDYSGSMNDLDKIGALKDAVAVFVSALQQSGANDRVGFSVYSTNGSLAQRLTFDLPDLLADVQGRSAGGWTNMGEGMERGSDELIDNARQGAKKLMVVMTDGMANRPEDRDPFQYVRDEAAACARAGIPIAAISFSEDSDRAIMQEMATTTEGVHYHVTGSVSQQEEELKRVFREIAAKRPLVLVE